MTEQREATEAAPAVSPERVIGSWNTICQRNWTLERKLIEFARLIWAENIREAGRRSAENGAGGSQHEHQALWGAGSASREHVRTPMLCDPLGCVASPSRRGAASSRPRRAQHARSARHLAGVLPLCRGADAGHGQATAAGPMPVVMRRCLRRGRWRRPGGLGRLRPSLRAWPAVRHPTPRHRRSKRGAPAARTPARPPTAASRHARTRPIGAADRRRHSWNAPCLKLR